jgi:hypothetical protein
LDKLKIAQGAAFDFYENKHAECLLGTRGELLRQVEGDPYISEKALGEYFSDPSLM